MDNGQKWTLVDDGLWTEVGFSGSGRGRKWALRRGVKTLVFLRLQPAQAHAGRSGRYQSVADCNFFYKLFSCRVDFPVAGIILIGVLKQYAFVAQSVEQLTLNQLVDGSNPPEGTSLTASILTGWGFFFGKKQQLRFFEALLVSVQ